MFLLLTVQFSNGSVKNADKLDFTMYKNTDESNPRKKSRRILVRKMKGCLRPLYHVCYVLVLLYLKRFHDCVLFSSVQVAESDRLSYVGNNFGTGSLKCNNLCQ